MDTRALTQAYEQGQQDAATQFSGASSKMAKVRESLMAKIYAGKKTLPESVSAAAAKKKKFPAGRPPGVPSSTPQTGAAVAKAAAIHEEGVRAALKKFGGVLPGLPEGLRRHLTVPKATMLAGGGAGLWDMSHGRGMGGSLGTAVGTGGGGLLGGMLAGRVAPGLGRAGQIGGTALGALLGRAVTKERRTEQPMPVQPYGQPY